MFLSALVEILLIAMVMSALLITCAVLSDAGPRNKPPGTGDAPNRDLPLPLGR